MNYEIAANILAEIKPARRKRERYRQRDEMQHRVIPLLPADDRDRFERAMNKHFRLLAYERKGQEP